MFINQVFQYAAHNNFALMINGFALVVNDVSDLVALDEEGRPHEFPAAGQEAWKKAQLAGENPKASFHPEHGWFVTHDFKDGEEDEPLCMICWAALGSVAINEVACNWWRAQGANPDGALPGVTGLHRESTPETYVEGSPNLDHKDLAQLIKVLSELNPEGDPHGIMDRPYLDMCKDYDINRDTNTPLTLTEWRNLTRESEDYGAAFSRNILDATDPFVFLVVLRDRMVHTSGCASVVITLINGIVDPIINAATMTWR